ncbi:unnamed protein product, partial [Oppiella nova]
MTGWRKNGLDVDDLFRCSRHDESQRIVRELESQPLLLGIVIEYFSKVENRTFEHACVAAGAVCFSSALLISLYHPAKFLVMQMGMRLRVSSCTLVYKKSLRLSRASLCKTTVGQIVNLMSNDVNRFDAFTAYVCNLLVAPVQTVIAIYIIYTEISYHCFIGVALLLLFVPFQAFMGKLFSKVRQLTAPLTDSRLRLMNEIISGMRVIKM